MSFVDLILQEDEMPCLLDVLDIGTAISMGTGRMAGFDPDINNEEVIRCFECLMAEVDEVMAEEFDPGYCGDSLDDYRDKETYTVCQSLKIRASRLLNQSTFKGYYVLNLHVHELNTLLLMAQVTADIYAIEKNASKLNNFRHLLEHRLLPTYDRHLQSIEAFYANQLIKK